MTREDVSKLFPDATDEQITKLLNQHNSEVTKEKNKAEKFKTDAEKADELQKQLDEINQQNMSDLEKEKARADAAEKLLQERSQALTKAKITSVFAEKGFTGDVYASVIESFALFDEKDAIEKATSFVNGLSETNTKSLEDAKAAWNKENLDRTPNPGSGSQGADNNGGEESEAARYAQQYSEKMNPGNNDSQENAPVNF